MKRKGTVMSHQELLEERLVDWNLKRQQGQDISAEDLCEDHPELVAELSELISNLKQMDWLESDDNSDDYFLPLPDVSRLDKYAATQLQDLNISTEEFSQRLIDSGLIDVQQVRQLREQHNSEDGQSFAIALVNDLKLTRFQANVLIEGHDHPLILDRYLILDELGAGGMGVVYKALHRKMDRIVALKILPKAAVDTPDKVKRFQREVEAVAKLEHPNIVTAHDAHTSKGIHYLVMSYVDGSDLAAIVRKQGVLSAKRAVNCVAQAARGLAHAHDMGIIHRDIKPGNLLLDKQDVVHVLDLGLARIDDLGIESDKEVSDDLTHPGMVMGTIAYLAPEQALDTHSADARSDIYSLGCTLFYLLTGEAPYPRETVMKTLLAHREEAIPDLSSKRVEVPKELNAIFQKMVSKSPEDRFQNMGEVMTALETLEVPDDLGVHQMPQAVPTFQDTDKFQETSIEIITTPAQTRRKPPAKSNLPVIAGGILAFVILLAGLIIKLQTPAGTLILEMEQPELAGAVVMIDGKEKVTIKTGDGDEMIEIKPDSEKHVLVVTHPDFEKFTKKFEFKTADDQTIKVWLEPKGIEEPKGFDLAAAGEKIKADVPDIAVMNKKPQEGDVNAGNKLEPIEDALIAAGEGNFGLLFDGVDDYVDLGENFRFNPNEPLTLEAWVRFDGVTKFKHQGVITSQPFQMLLNDNKNQWQVYVRDFKFGGGAQASLKSEKMKLIRDYELSVPLVFHDQSGIMQYLGMDYLWKSSPWGVLDGVMDEVRISNVARYDHDFTPSTKFEVDQHTLALYHFDEGKGDVLKDSSGKGHDGKIHGAKWYQNGK
jgi:serine/threonine protein kinase